MGEGSFVNLQFEASGKWHNLPKWSEFFIHVGEELSFVETDSTNRIVTAIVVPTRAYCAALISLGMIMSDATKMGQLSQKDHFRMLLDMQPGTHVIYNQEHGRTFKGIVLEPGEIQGKPCVRVQLSSKEGGGLTYSVSEAGAFTVQQAKHSGKLHKKPSGKNKRLSNEFVSCLLGEHASIQFGIQSKFICSIVGKKSFLEYEIRQTRFAVPVSEEHREKGCLQDVLKIDRFLTGEQAYRSTLVSVGVSQPSNDIISKIEMGVVFDGAAGFLKWGTKWPNHHQAIILDRADPYLDDAVHVINSRFSQNRSSLARPVPYSKILPPPGTEMLTFWEVIP